MRCAICLEQVRSVLIFKTTKRCNHSFCRDCISRYIIASTDSGVVNVRCPGFYCDAMLDPVYCRQLVSGERFLLWCDLLCESSVLGFARCYCPNLNCRELIISGRGGGNGNVGRFKCPRCGQSGCFLCARPWVEGHRCNDRDTANIHLLERLAERKQWKRCPNCNIYVERLGGCGTISCRCGTRFCYGCGRKSGLSCVCREDRGRRIVAEVFVWLHCALVLLGVLAVILQPLLGYSL